VERNAWWSEGLFERQLDGCWRHALCCVSPQLSARLSLCWSIDVISNVYVEDITPLTDAIRGQPNPPCKRCYFRKKCATELMACREFTMYLNLKASAARGDRSPSRARYEMAFPLND
jgi:hypothetical protein